MSQYWMLEAALRSLAMGVAIFAALKVMRVRQVRAQRTAWLLALLAAIAMPALVRWPIVMRLPAVHLPSFVAGLPAPSGTTQPGPSLILPSPSSKGSVTGLRSTVRYDSLPRASAKQPALSTIWSSIGSHALSYAVPIYVFVVTLLMVRLAIGLGLTWQLLRHAAPAYLPGSSDIRISDAIRTPVTIGSTIVLPAQSARWDPAKLNVVVAHERSHVKNADFYVQLLASIHCAVFWFSPFSWWLQSRLAALGEALGDLAALQQAQSRSSYAEVLLEFATAVRQPIGAVAMARAGGLCSRIERLLNDRLFRDAFSETRRHPYLAASVVPIALLVSASFIRIEDRHVQAAEMHPSPVLAAKPVAILLPESAPASSQTSMNLVRAEALRQNAEDLAASDSADKLRAEAAARVRIQDESAKDKQTSDSDWDGDSFALALMSSDGVTLTTKRSANTLNRDSNGNYNDRVQDLRQKVKGDFIYYNHAGKAYVITDPALIAQAKALYAPMEALGKQQEELGRQQEALGAQQELLGKQQEAINVPTPDFTKELDRLSELTAKMKTLQASKTVDEQTLADMQEKMADIQGKLGELQGYAGAEQGKLGDKQGKLGEEQGKLGEEQGRLGEQQGKLAEEANRKLKPLIEKAIRDGLAKQVD